MSDHALSRVPSAPRPPQDVVKKLLPHFRGKKVALVHEWLLSQRGGENVFAAICELFRQLKLMEDAQKREGHSNSNLSLDVGVFALLHEEASVSASIEALGPVHTSFLQKIPGIKKTYRHFLPLMPWAVRGLDVSSYDYVISSSHCVAKGVRKGSHSKHISYVHAPMRYMWDRFGEYFNRTRSSLVTLLGAHLFRPFLQSWDRRSARHVDGFLVNSRFIASRVKDIYGSIATVVYPFCDTDFFTAAAQACRVSGAQSNDSYLIVSALVPYKRLDLAIEACAKVKRKLIVVGDGPDLGRLKTLAQTCGAEVSFLGSASRSELVELYVTSRALLFPGVEDFGIVPLEAMACGLPVIAFGQGGALETVVDGTTGVFFQEETILGLASAMEKFEKLCVTLENKRVWSERCMKRAAEFDADAFYRAFAEGLLH